MGPEHHLCHQAGDPTRNRGGVCQPPRDPEEPARAGGDALSDRVDDAGRKLTVAFIYYAETNTAYPITAWER
jgi:hypothetical protein